MSSIPLDIAERILAFLDRPRIKAISITDVPDYPVKYVKQEELVHIIGCPNHCHDPNCPNIRTQIIEQFIYSMPCKRDILTLRAVHPSFWDLLPFHTLRQLYDIDQFVSAHSRIMENSQKFDMRWCAFPRPEYDPLYWEWHNHKEHGYRNYRYGCSWCHDLMQLRCLDWSALYPSIIVSGRGILGRTVEWSPPPVYGDFFSTVLLHVNLPPLEQRPTGQVNISRAREFYREYVATGARGDAGPPARIGDRRLSERQLLKDRKAQNRQQQKNRWHQHKNQKNQGRR